MARKVEFLFLVLGKSFALIFIQNRLDENQALIEFLNVSF